MAFQSQFAQENFNAGEFGARMAARVQFDKYKNAGSVYENVLPLPQGGFTGRPGTRYIAGAKSNSVRSWLLPFVFSTTQAYVLELGAQAMRFFRNQGQISAADVGAAITNGDFAANITGWTARNTGTGSVAWDSTNADMNLIGAGAGNEARAYQEVTTTSTNVEHVVRFKVVGAAGDYANVRVGSSAGGSQFLAAVRKPVGWHTIQFTPTASPFFLEFENEMNKTVSIDDVVILDNVPVEIPTPWGEADLPNLSFAQSADLVYFALGGATRNYRLERYGHSSWSLVNVLWEDGPYLDKNTTATTLTLGATSGNNVTVTASAVKGINDDAGFRATDVGRLIRWEDSSNDWTWMQITAVGSTTQVTVDILGPTASATTATADWRLGEYNDTDGWPSVVSFVQQRLALAGTTKQPQKFWLSESGNIETFADQDKDGVVQSDSSIVYRFAAREVNAIRWIAARKKPIIGTVGGEWTLRSDGAVLTPTDIAADFEVSGGTARIQPLEIRSRLVFVQTQARKIVEFADIIQANGLQGYDAFDLTLLNDRVLKDGVVQLTYQQEPDSTIWAVRGDGQVAALTYQPEQNVIGWSRHILGGSFEGGDAVIESVCSIPGQDGAGQFKSSAGRYEVWFAVKRTVNGNTVRYIECMEKLFNGDEDLQEEAFYVDSGLTLDNPVTITGVTQANPGVVTATAHGFSNGDLVRIVRVKGMTELNGKTYKVANAAANTFELTDEDDADIDTTGFTAYVSGGQARKKVSSVSGLSHLEGQTVSVFADGAIQTNKTVASGAVTLDAPASLVHVGLPYEGRWRSLKLAVDTREGSTIGEPKNIADVILVLMETAEGSLSVATEDGDGENEFTELDLRSATAIDANPVSFFTGEKRLGVAAGHDEDMRVVLKGSAPAPFTVLALMHELETST
jgi:hypothetical protein